MILILLLCTKEPKNNYRSQTKFAKVMFSQLFVCQRGRGFPVQGLLSFCLGSFCPGGSLSRGSRSRGFCPSVRGVSVQGDFCPGVSIQGVSVQGGRCPGGSLSRGSLSGGSLSRRVSVRGASVWGSCPGSSLSRGFSVRGVFVREIPHIVKWGQYASYWNAFLLKISLHFKIN